ncbi:MAG: hypothetical protein L6R37_002915 [Teloschistes peruensis]|nr:MAG: hypothetical protein L6R37_002915 [Teloschistes peruensis]
MMVSSTHLKSYSFRNGLITVDDWAAINTKASSIFSRLQPEALLNLPQLHRGILLAISNANEPGDIAVAWEANFDQIHLTALTGVLLAQPPISLAEISTVQVTRIPRAPFAALTLLDLLYATIGTCLMIAAAIAVRKGHGVKDAQARLSTLAVVAESFESPAWGDDAKNVDMLFAERRGEGTRRIALVRRRGGGRRFKQIVLPQNYAKRPLSATATKAVSPQSARTQLGVRAPERTSSLYQPSVWAATIPSATLHEA